MKHFLFHETPLPSGSVHAGCSGLRSALSGPASQPLDGQALWSFSDGSGSGKALAGCASLLLDCSLLLVATSAARLIFQPRRSAVCSQPALFDNLSRCSLRLSPLPVSPNAHLRLRSSAGPETLRLQERGSLPNHFLACKRPPHIDRLYRPRLSSKPWAIAARVCSRQTVVSRHCVRSRLHICACLRRLLLGSDMGALG